MTDLYKKTKKKTKNDGRKSPTNSYHKTPKPCSKKPHLSDDGIHFEISMERKAGCALIDWITYNDNYNRTPKELCGLFLEISKRLEDIHNQGYYHMDVRPENIMIDPSTIKRDKNNKKVKVSFIDFEKSIVFAEGEDNTYHNSDKVYSYPCPEMLEIIECKDYECDSNEDYDEVEPYYIIKPNKKINCEKYELWCLGCCFFITMFGCYPQEEFINKKRTLGSIGEDGKPICISSKKFFVPPPSSNDSESNDSYCRYYGEIEYDDNRFESKKNGTYFTYYNHNEVFKDLYNQYSYFLKWLIDHLLCDNPNDRSSLSEVITMLRSVRDSEECSFSIL